MPAIRRPDSLTIVRRVDPGRALAGTRYSLSGMVAAALADIAQGLRRRHVWIALASEDISDQHRRTTLGPLWLLVNYFAFALTFIFIFQRGGGGGENYAAYVATGLLVWFFIMEAINSSVTLFVRDESYIKGTTLPLSVYVLRTTLQSLMRAGYALIGCLVILIFSGVPLTLAWGWALVGMALIALVAPAIITCFAFLGVFFPDSQFIVGNLMRVGMFITPVFWMPDNVGGLRRVLYDYNPFTWFLDIVRMPVLTGRFPFGEFGLCLLIGVAAWIVAILLLGRFRRQVALVL